MITAAIVGLGWWGKKLTASIAGSDKMQFGLGVEPDRATAETVGASVDFPIVDTYEAALADDRIDAVILATPHKLHDAQIAAAARAGKHIFCEKPLSLTKAGAEASVAACAARNLVLGIGHERRWEPPVADALQAARTGVLGTLLQVEANFSHDRFTKLDAANWRLAPDNAPAGGMTATGIHVFDLATAMLGEAETAFASAEGLASAMPNGDTACAMVKYKSGAVAFVSALSATPFISRFAVYGSKGWIEIRDKAHVENPRGWIVQKCFEEDAVDIQDLPAAQPVRDNLEAFADAVAGVAPYPIKPDEMVRNTAVMQAVFESAATGKQVAVP